MHGKAHEGADEWRDGVKICRGLRLRSLRLGLSGQADVVEFHPAGNGEPGIALRGEAGRWSVFPVEYKHGSSKISDCDRIQLCAQALCLEEMLGASIPRGALFYGKQRRRENVDLDAGLREKTERLCERMHALYRAGMTPPGQYEKKCGQCSLLELCLPAVAGAGKSARQYLRRQVREALREE